MVEVYGHKLGLATKNKKRGDPKVAPFCIHPALRPGIRLTTAGLVRLGRADIAKAIVGSAEAASKANSDFIDSLYQSALDRTADDAGKAHWAAQLEAGASQADVALGIVGSAEAAAHIDNVVVLHGQV